MVADHGITRRRSLAAELEDCGSLSPTRTLFWLIPVEACIRAYHAVGEIIGPFGPADLVIARHPTGDTPTVLVRSRPQPPDAYTAPELGVRVPPTAASDVYSLAAIAYHCLTGSPPSKEEPRPTGLEDAILRAEVRLALASALEPDPDHRDSIPSSVLAGIAVLQRSPCRRKRSQR